MNSNLISRNRALITGSSFSILNSVFLIRLLWQIGCSNYKEASPALLILFIIIQIILILAGFKLQLSEKLLKVISIPGTPFLGFIVFYISKRVLKELLVSQSDIFKLDVSAWFLSLFLWIVCVLIFQSIADLAHRTQPESESTTSGQIPSKIIFIAFLSIVFLISCFWLYTQIINPLPSYANYDPEISYLVNSLTPFKDLELYQRMDHPGTFMQLIGSMIVVILSPLSMMEGGFPYQYHLKHPEAYLFTARLILLLINIGVIYLLYKFFLKINKWPEILAGVSIMLVYFASHKLSLEFLTIWSPNAFNFAVGTAILLTLYRILTRGNNIPNRTLWMYSIAVGLGATFHVYMITLVLASASAIFLSIIFENKDWYLAIKTSAKIFLGSILGYISGTLTILPHYESYFKWIKNVISHQGAYGQGETGFISIDLFLGNLRYLMKSNWVLFAIFGSLTLLIIVLWFIKRNEENTYSKIWAFILGLNVQIISLLFIIGKQPGHRYLLSIASVLPLYILALYDLTKNNQVLSKVLFSTISISLSAFFIVNLATSLNNHNDKVDYLSDYQDEITHFVVDYSEEKQISPDQVTIYWTYGTYSHCYSLWFGNDFSKSRFTDEIIDVCPNELQFDVWDQSITGTKDRGIEVLTEQQEYSIMIGRERYLEKYDGDAFIVNSNVKNLSFIYFR